MAIAPVRLDRLLKFERVANPDGTVNGDFQAKWQKVMEEIENSVNAVIDAQNAADAANAAAAAADAAALAATTAASTAQSAADTVAADSSLASSGVTGLTLTATDAGTDATVTISAHTRIYGDGTSVSVLGGSVTGLAYSTEYWIFYDQSSRAGGSVTYQATTSPSTAAQTGDRHSLGAVTTPAGGGGPIDGNINLPPGIVLP